MVKFYFLPGSLHSLKAEELLQRKGITFEKIDVSDRVLLGALSTEVRLTRFPAVVWGESYYEGLAAIESLLSAADGTLGRGGAIT